MLRTAARHIATLLLPLLASAFPAAAQDSIPAAPGRLSFGGSAGYGYLLNGSGYGKEIIQSHNTAFYSIYAGHQAAPSTLNPYDRAYGLPTIEGGIILADYSHIHLDRGHKDTPYVSGMGYEVAAYAAFRRDVLQSRRWRAGYSLENGIGFSTRPYNRYDNADNEFTGSRAAIYIGIGFYGSYRISKHWQAALGFNFKHFSNGALDRPNKGANSLSLEARIAYIPQPAEGKPGLAEKSPQNAAKRPKHLYGEFSVGWSGHTLLDEWLYNYWNLPKDDKNYRSGHCRIYSSPVFNLALMYRYSLKYASGIGLDYTYATYTGRTREVEELRHTTGYGHSRHVAGLSLRHEAFYKHFSLHMSLGAYLFRRMGYMAHVDEKPYYETIGIRYYLPFADSRFYVGYNVKAHLLKADCMQLHAGMTFGKRNKRNPKQP